MKILDIPQSGSIAGITSSRNRFGQYRRTRAIPTNPNSTAQSLVREMLSTCSSNWAGLTPEQRAAWVSSAALHPKTDSLGQSVTLTGAQWFNAVNCQLTRLGLTAVNAPPSEQFPVAPVLGTISLEWVAAELTTATVAFTPTPIPALCRVIIFVSAPRSSGTMYNGDWRYIQTAPPAGTSPVNFAANYVTKFGVPAVGQKIYARAKHLVTDGGFSPWSNIVSGTVQDGT